MPDPIVVRDPEVCGGVPTIRGTRITVSLCQRLREDERSWSNVIAAYPRLAHLTQQDIDTIISYPRLDRRWNPTSDIAVDADNEWVAVNDPDGEISFRTSDIPALIAALTEAHAAYERWEEAVEQWERNHGGAA